MRTRRGLLLAAAGIGLALVLLRPAPGPHPAGTGPAGTGPADRNPGAASPEAPSLPSPPGPALRGIVVDGSGAPVEGAEVAAARDGERVPARTVTGADGRFALAVAADGEHLLGARAPGRAPVLRGGVRPGTGEVRVVLQPGIRLAGRVRDGASLPCAGARVRAVLSFPGMGRDVGGFETRTDESGAYAFENLPAVECTVRARYRDASSEPVTLLLPAGPGTAERDLRVDAGPPPEAPAADPDAAPPCRATFRVVDAAGTPVPAVRTLAFRGGDPAPAGSGSLGADGSGVFRTGRLRPGDHRIDLRCAAGTGSTGPFSVAAGETADLGTIRLVPGAAVTGRILDPSGAPAPSARVFADEGSLPEAGSVAADGTFRLRGLPAGSGRIRIRLAGCAERSVPWIAGPGESADLGDIALRAATGAVRGSVRSRSGRPVGGAGIRISPWDDVGPGADVRRIAAGPDGWFEASALAAGRWVVSGVGAFASNGNGQRIDLADGESKEIVLDVD